MCRLSKSNMCHLIPAASPKKTMTLRVMCRMWDRSSAASSAKTINAKDVEIELKLWIKVSHFYSSFFIVRKYYRGWKKAHFSLLRKEGTWAQVKPEQKHCSSPWLLHFTSWCSWLCGLQSNVTLLNGWAWFELKSERLKQSKPQGLFFPPTNSLNQHSNRKFSKERSGEAIQTWIGHFVVRGMVTGHNLWNL